MEVIHKLSPLFTGLYSRSESFWKAFIASSTWHRLAKINHRDPPCQRLLVEIFNVGKCLSLLRANGAKRPGPPCTHLECVALLLDPYSIWQQPCHC